MRATTGAALAAVMALAACKVKVKDGGKLPEVDVRDSSGTQQIEVKPGTMPDVDVKAESVAVPNIKAPEIKAPHLEPPKVHLPDVDAGRGHVKTDTAHHR